MMSDGVRSRRWAQVEVLARQRAARGRPDARRNGRQAPPPAPPSPLPPPARAPADRAKASGSSSLITSRRLSCRRRRGTLPKAIRGWPTRWCSSRCSSQPCSGSGSQSTPAHPRHQQVSDQRSSVRANKAPERTCCTSSAAMPNLGERAALRLRARVPILQADSGQLRLRASSTQGSPAGKQRRAPQGGRGGLLDHLDDDGAGRARAGGCAVRR